MKQYIYDGTKYVLHEDVVGLSELPTPSAKYLDKAYLLTAVQTGYEKGAIYECHEVTPATDPKTYEWVKVINSPDDMYKVYSGTYDSVEGEFYDDEGNALPKVDGQRYYDVITRTTWIYYSAWSGFFRLFNDIVGMTSSQMLSPLIKEYYPELNVVSFRCMNLSGNDGGLVEGFIYKLDRVSVTPEAGDSPVDEGWWEVDSTTGKMIQTEDTEVVSGKLYFDYVWTQVKTQQSVFPGTLDEWNALTPAEQAQYDYLADNESDNQVITIYPDWGHAERILSSSDTYTVIQNGFICGHFDKFESGTGRLFFKVNDIEVAMAQGSTSWQSGATIPLTPVRVGDVLAFEAASGATSKRNSVSKVYFMPNLKV